MMIIDKVNDIINGHTSKNSLYVFCVFIQAIVQQVVHHQTNGVHGALRHGCVAGLAPAADAHAVAFRLQRDVGGILQLRDVGPACRQLL